MLVYVFFFFQAEDGIRDLTVTGVQTCALPISFDPARDLFAILRSRRMAKRSRAGSKASCYSSRSGGHERDAGHRGRRAQTARAEPALVVGPRHCRALGPARSRALGGDA